MEKLIEIQNDLLIEDLIVKYRIDSERKEKLLKEELLTEFDWELVLLGLGFIPVIGEVFDTILIIKYFKERRWIEAFLMMIALIPTVGDIAVKPFLFAGRGLKAFTSTGKFASILKNNKKFAAMYEKVAKYFGSPKVMALGKQIAGKEPKLASEINKAKSFHVKMANDISKKATPFHINRSGYAVMGAKKNILGKAKKGLGFTTQQIFRNKAITKYVSKHGALPKNGLSTWYNIVYKGRRARRSAFRKALLASGVLGSLGLPNIESFQDFIATPEGAEQAMNNEQFQKLYGQFTTAEDEQLLQQQLMGQEPPEESGGIDYSSMLSIPFMKKMGASAAAAGLI